MHRHRGVLRDVRTRAGLAGKGIKVVEGHSAAVECIDASLADRPVPVIEVDPPKRKVLRPKAPPAWLVQR